MEYNIKVTMDGDTLTIREGAALELMQPVKLELSGVLDSPRKWIEKRVETFSHLSAGITVNREKMSISLRIDEKNYFSDSIKGAITLSPEFTKWGINNDQVQYHSHELALKIKMNRSQFSSIEKATELVTIFQNLKAKVQREIDQSDNQRGNVKKNYSQVVHDLSIPESFAINVPLFKGDAKREIKVEIVIDPETLKCSLISPDAAYLLDTIRDQMIDAEIKQIGEIAPNIVIIEV
jgi:hypothetical protein